MNIYETNSLNFVFIQVAKLHRHSVHELLSVKEIYPGQPHLLHLLIERDGQSQRELAEKMQITPATVAVMLGRMEKAGLVERRADAEDHRISRVFLTDKGRQAHLDGRKAMEEVEKASFANFTPEERIVLRRLLLQMYENLKQADFKSKD